MASAVGSLSAGFVTTALVQQYGFSALDSYRIIFVQYGGAAVLLMLLVCMLSQRVERGQGGSSGGGGGKGTASTSVELSIGGGGGGPGSCRKAPDNDDTTAGVQDSEAGGDDAESRPLLLQEREGAIPLSASGRMSAASGEVSVAAGPGGSRQPSAAGSASGSSAWVDKLLGLSPKSRRTVVHLSLLFALDSFGGGLTTGTLIAYYFQVCECVKLGGGAVSQADSQTLSLTSVLLWPAC